MNFQTSVKTCLTEKYAGFSGRASRSEYWWFVLAYVIGGVIVSLLSAVLYLIYVLALIVPGAAVGYRRLQDTGREGWYIFIPMGLGLLSSLLALTGSVTLQAIVSLVTLVVGLVFLWWLTRPSQPETNAYGPPPSQ